MNYAGYDRVFYLYTPDGPSTPRPMVLLLHGSGSDGLALLKLWKPIASREGVELLAPDSLHTDVGWDLHADGPELIYTVVATAASKHSIDPSRVYVFGQSGGAVYALILGCLESKFFAAVAIHAGGWRNTSEFQTAHYAKRAIPVLITVGDQDEFFALAGVENTKKSLEDRGIPVTLNVLKDRHHTILDVPPDYFDGVWAFLKEKSLGEPPTFTVYRDPANLGLKAPGINDDTGAMSR